MLDALRQAANNYFIVAKKGKGEEAEAKEIEGGLATSEEPSKMQGNIMKLIEETNQCTIQEFHSSLTGGGYGNNQPNPRVNGPSPVNYQANGGVNYDGRGVGMNYNGQVGGVSYGEQGLGGGMKYGGLGSSVNYGVQGGGMNHGGGGPGANGGVNSNGGQGAIYGVQGVGMNYVGQGSGGGLCGFGANVGGMGGGPNFGGPIGAMITPRS
jgi:hypothetical protein